MLSHGPRHSGSRESTRPSVSLSIQSVHKVTRPLQELGRQVSSIGSSSPSGPRAKGRSLTSSTSRGPESVEDTSSDEGRSPVTSSEVELSEWMPLASPALASTVVIGVSEHAEIKEEMVRT